MWTSCFGLSDCSLLYRKIRKNSSLFPYFREIRAEKKLWKGGGQDVGGIPPFHSGKRRLPQIVKSGRKEGKLVYRLLHNVERKLRVFYTAVENFLVIFRGMCYNRAMEYQEPDFGRIGALYEQKRDAFQAFRALLLSYNARFNLTSITGEEEIYYKHFLDSLAGEAYFPRGASVAEVGSGAGFPSVPLMLVRPDLKFFLFESTGKKCEFLRTAVKELSINAEVFCMRAEDAARGAHREKYDVCCARAVARLDTLAEYCLPLVRRGGTFVAYKGADSELGCAERAISLLGGTEARAVSYELPASYGKRNLILVTKGKPTPAAFPRGRGAERKAPL